jgi:DNA-binding MarR family transcriptional regulator
MKRNDVIHKLLKLIKQLDLLDRDLRTYGTGVQLTFSEIHMIHEISVHKSPHVTALAEKIGITKGAVSQMTDKLVKKGFLIKEMDPSNQSRKILRLSSLGIEAERTHQNYHRAFESRVLELLDRYSELDRKRIEMFLDDLLDATEHLERDLY